MGYDRTAPKRAINVNLNDDLLRQAGLLTTDLDGTLEVLLAEFVRRGQPRSDDAEVAEFIAVMNAFHAEHGLLSDEFSNL